MSIDDMFLRDPRVLKLASRLGWSKYETRGRLLDVYAIVYDRVDAGASETLEPFEIDGAADFPGLHEHMIACNLAEKSRERIRVKGAYERTRYLATREESGRAGGIKSGESRRNKAKVAAKVTFAKNEGRSNPSVPDLVPDLPSASASASASVDLPDLVPEEFGEQGSLPTIQAKCDSLPDERRNRHQPALDLFHERYLAAYGAKPTWGAKQVAMLKRLVDAHGAPEVERRIEIMFRSPPSWIRPPFDVGTLVQHFDKFVAAVVERADPRRGLTPAEIIALGERMGAERDAG